MKLVKTVDSVVSIMRPAPSIISAPCILLVFSLVAVFEGCKPRPARHVDEGYNPYCKSTRHIAKVCPLDFASKCPRLTLADMSSNQSNQQSRDTTNIGLMSWSTNISIHGQSAVMFFLLGCAVMLAVVFGIIRCKQGHRHKTTVKDLLEQIAARPTTSPVITNTPMLLHSLWTPSRLVLGGGGVQQTSRHGLPSLDYVERFE